MGLRIDFRPLARDDVAIELLFAAAQARRRRLRRRATYVTVLLVAGLLVGLDRSGVIGSVSGAHLSAAGSGTPLQGSAGPVATSSDSLLDPYYLDPHSLGDHAEFWYSNDGTVEEEYVYAGDGYSFDSGERGSGPLVSVERSSYRVVHGVGEVTTTVIFPTQHAFATYTTSSKAESADVFYLSPSFIRRGLAARTLITFGGTTIDGRHVVQVWDAHSSQPMLGWIDPRDEEIISTIALSTAGADGDIGVRRVYYRWTPGTPANLAHLKLVVPAGFHEVARLYALHPWEIPGRPS